MLSTHTWNLLRCFYVLRYELQGEHLCHREFYSIRFLINIRVAFICSSAREKYAYMFILKAFMGQYPGHYLCLKNKYDIISDTNYLSFFSLQFILKCFDAQELRI